jgi:GntR family transcriptional regulator of gluconate operon
VAEELRVQIITGQLEPGTHLVEGALAESFDVSRGPVRDALRQLELEGLVASRRGRGGNRAGRAGRVVVTGLSGSDVDELYSLRETLESMAVRLAASLHGGNSQHGGNGQATDDDSAGWKLAAECVTGMRQCADDRDAVRFAELDMVFHGQFYRLSGHRRLASVWDQYCPVFAVMLSVTTAQDRDLHPSAEAHAELLAAARDGDAETAVSLLAEHLLGSRNRLRDALARRQASPQH